MKFSPTPYLLQFGTLPPSVVIEHGGKVYVHTTQDPANPHTAPSKKARKHAASKARKERLALVMGARGLLKSSETSLVATTKESRSTLAIQQDEAEVMEKLDKEAYLLSSSV
ncbi:hypothetical protein E2562_013000 [Oryza meyeriana var. granulata]|uniref:Uncharacterized protein n=1 Tax=Oryza meyeriana var. granulata TaxID=110450 RepID=A0A6G1DIP2_9ORYZ|nr:hypothetical protein E2562_013000 [Oryza meyeriana var. granulata]